MSPPDIFLSYNREDQAVARLYAEAFAAEGFEVWWDVTLRSGEAYDEVTEAALRGAKAVVVLWSPRSVMSRWVRAEATLAERNKTFVPATIEACERPIMFELTQTADLSHWNGETTDRVWQAFCQDVHRFVGRSMAAESAAPATIAAAPLPRLDQLSIVVLPFANMSGDPEQDYFADGISEDIITDLSKVSALGVISRNTAFSFKGKSLDVRQVASQLNVTHVLEGSVRKSGNRVRISAQLIEGSSDNHVWAERWDRDLDGIFELQDELSKAIVDALRLKLLPKEKKAIETRGTDHVEAYDLYLRAQELSRSFAPDDTRRALELYHKALELDPGFLLALHGLSAALPRAILTTAGDPVHLFAEREAVLETQLALAPDAWQTHLAIGEHHLNEFRVLEAEQALLKAKKAAPASETRPLLQHASFLVIVGRMHEALASLKAALRMEPLSIELSLLFQEALHSAGQFEEAEREFERSKDLVGQRTPIEFLWFLHVAQQGDLARTRQQLTRYVRYNGLMTTVLTKLADLLDKPDAAREVVRGELAKPESQHPTSQVLLAEMAALFGDTDTALAAIRRSVVELRSVLRSDAWIPTLANVRRDLGYKALLRKRGIYDYWRQSGNWGDFARPLGDDDFEVIG